MRILIASANPHKIEEIRRMLPLRFDIVSAAEFDIEFPPEVGTTFRENAVAKADFASSASGLPAIADDSGLVVPALGGAPGVRSARYAGDDATDAENVNKLLLDLRHLSHPSRDAWFACVVALVVPGHPTQTVEGRIDGRIADAPRGDNGFGYDPIFMLDDGRTFAELPANEKDSISHRGHALRNLADKLVDFQYPS